MDENIGRTFLLWNVYHCYSTTKGAIDKWMEQPDSTHQIGLGPTLHRVLILGWWCCPRWKVQSSLGEIFTCGIWDIFTCSSTTKGAIAEWRPKLDSTRQRGTEATLEAFLIVVESGALQVRAEEVRAEFFVLRLWKCSGHPCNKQQSYGQWLCI